MGPKAKKIEAAEGKVNTSGAISVSAIKADTKWNTRQGDLHLSKPRSDSGAHVPSGKEEYLSADSALVQSIKEQGLLENLVVRQLPDGTYALVAGFRRFAAIRVLGWKTVMCTNLGPITEGEALLANGVENMQRADLSPGEQADLFIRLRDESGLKGEETAMKLGVSKAYVNNMIRAAQKLHPEIWKRYRTGRDKSMPGKDVIFQWASLDHESQLRRWKGLPDDVPVGAAVAAASPDANKPRQPEGPSRPGKADLERVLAAVRVQRKSGDMAEHVAQGLETALCYCLGVKGGGLLVQVNERAIKAEKSAKEAAKAAEKAAKDAEKAAAAS